MKLVKLLALTQSSNDHEALSAMRKANEVLRGLGKTWDEIVNPSLDGASHPARDKGSAGDRFSRSIQDMIEHCLKNIVKGTFHHDDVMRMKREFDRGGMRPSDLGQLKEYYDQVKKARG